MAHRLASRRSTLARRERLRVQVLRQMKGGKAAVPVEVKKERKAGFVRRFVREVRGK